MTPDHERANASELVHGMGAELVAPDWPPLRREEVRDLLARYSWIGDGNADAFIVWRSPRPMSTAAVVRCGTTAVFVKRHHARVRSRERLEREHQLARHLGSAGVGVAAVLATTSGETVVESGEYLYEVHDVARGVDLYRDVPSWYPFTSTGHGFDAGRALARFHRAAQDFAAPSSNLEVLSNAVVLINSSDPWRELERLLSHRSGLARALASFDLERDFRRWLVPLIDDASAHLAEQHPQWTHGDWHPSNLTWSSTDERATVVEVLDLGLANVTYAVHDIAIAIERSCVDWLDLQQCGTVRADLAMVDALIDGYERVTPLGPEGLLALAAVLPVAHVEFALSEVEYFADVVCSPANTDLAYEGYLLGHAKWFHGANGSLLLEGLVDRARRAKKLRR